MTQFMTTTNSLRHQATVDALRDDQHFVVFIRCREVATQIANTDDYWLQFYVGKPGQYTGPFIFSYAEAESGQLEAPMVVSANQYASGGSFISNTQAGAGSMRWTVNIAREGEYVVWGRVLSNSGNNDSITISVDGGVDDVWDTAEGLWSPLWQWTRVTSRNSLNGSPSLWNMRPKRFIFSAGSHVITFKGRDIATNLDRLVITDDLAFIPTEGNGSGFDSLPPSSPTDLRNEGG